MFVINYIPLQDQKEEDADKEFGGEFGFSAEGRKRWLGAWTGEILQRQKYK